MACQHQEIFYEPCGHIVIVIDHHHTCIRFQDFEHPRDGQNQTQGPCQAVEVVTARSDRICFRCFFMNSTEGLASWPEVTELVLLDDMEDVRYPPQDTQQDLPQELITQRRIRFAAQINENAHRGHIMFHPVGLAHYVVNYLFLEPRPEPPAPRVLHLLPVENAENEECPVCKEGYDVQEHRPVQTRCRHEFGERCIRAWIDDDNDSCPTCRGYVFEDEDEEEEEEEE